MGRSERHPGGKPIDYGNGLGMEVGGLVTEGMVVLVTKVGNPERGLDWKVERED